MLFIMTTSKKGSLELEGGQQSVGIPRPAPDASPGG